MTLAALAITAIYLGGAGADDCDDIAFDRAGYAWLTCHSTSQGFTGPEKADKKDMDAFVIKFDPPRRASCRQPALAEAAGMQPSASSSMQAVQCG